MHLAYMWGQMLQNKLWWFIFLVFECLENGTFDNMPKPTTVEAAVRVE